MVLNVLIACEESQAECKAFRDLGHNAFSCDIVRCRRGGHPGWHIIGDATPYLRGATVFVTQMGDKMEVPRWDLIIAHPPCTYLCKVSSPWMYENPDGFIPWRGALIHISMDRYSRMCTARRFFMECLNAAADYVAVENPLPMALAELPQPSCYIQPSWFGVPYTKKTLYWLRNLPPVMAEIEHPAPRCFVTCSRGKYRSRTFTQVARALARQWSDFICEERRQK